MIDLLIVLAFVAYSVTAGFRARSAASKNLEEYFLAGRTIKGWRAGLSMAATQYAADTPLLVAGLIATGGLFALWRLWIYGLAFLMMGFLLGRAWRRAMVLTDAELVETRYSGDIGVTVLRGLKAIYFGTVINCTVLAMVLVAATRICEIFLPWHQWLPEGLYGVIQGVIRAVGQVLDLGGLASGVSGLETSVAITNNSISIFCILLFVALYSTTGGLRSVVTTDIAQFSLAMLATLIYAIYAVANAGGIGVMLRSLTDLYGEMRANEILGLTPASGEALLPFLVIIGLQWFFQMNSDGTGYLAQRTMACSSDRGARLAGFVFTWAQIFLRTMLWLPIGVALLILYPYEPSAAQEPNFAAGRELLFVTGIQDLLQVGIKGLMLTGLLAALASTIDTHLNWGASYWSNDIYRGIVNRRILGRDPGPRESVVVARLSNILILGISLTIMAFLGSIQQAWVISLLFGAGIGSVLVLRWFWERINLYSEMAAIAASLVIAPTFLGIPAAVFDWLADRAALGWLRPALEFTAAFFSRLVVEQDWLRLLLMSVLSTVAVLVVTWLTPRTQTGVLDAFYRKVRPPGWWKSTASRVGADPQESVRAFKEGAYLVLTTATTIYLTLVGMTKLLLPTSGGSRLLGLLCLLLALATLPLWWRRVRVTREQA